MASEIGLPLALLSPCSWECHPRIAPWLLMPAALLVSSLAGVRRRLSSAREVALLTSLIGAAGSGAGVVALVRRARTVRVAAVDVRVVAGEDVGTRARARVFAQVVSDLVAITPLSGRSR